MNDFSLLEKKLGIFFKDKNLLIQSFTHRSYLNENPDFKLFHNERLEFLGDAVLEHVVTEYLFLSYPNKMEGELTAWRAALVNSKILFEIAKELNFGDFLLLSQGEKKEENKSRQYILANTMEAFIGGLYLDQGMEACSKFIKEHIIKHLPRIIEGNLHKSAKSKFQEIAQEKTSITPTYSVIKESGPDHDKIFAMGVYLGKDLIATGEGKSKQEAEEEAARKALDKIKI
ncbi:MAG: ribonuclease III [Candidatus Paceibacterota bacterium]